jgi:hypothetical protein
MKTLHYTILLSLLSLNYTNAQISVELPTNYVNRVAYGFVEDLGDSTIRCGYYTGVNGMVENMISLTMRKSDLIALDTTVIWSRNGRNINLDAGLYFQQCGNNWYYVDTWQNDSNDVTSYISISLLNQDKTPGNHLFTKRWSGWQVKGEPKIIGDSLYVLLSTRSFGDTSFIEVYDLQGSLVAKKYYDFITLTGYSVNNLNYNIAQDSTLVITDKLNGNLLLVNRFSLDTIKTLRIDGVAMANHEYGSMYPVLTVGSKDYITQMGNISMLFGINSGNLTADDQIYLYRRNWSGDSLYLVNLGPKNVDNDAFAFLDNSNGAEPNFISAGRLPARLELIPSLPNQVIIYRHNQFGSDSILLFGADNHLPTTLFGDDNGDLYMFSSYTLVNSTGETRGVLTKIPAYLIGLIEDKKVSPQVIVYPNPTADRVQFDLGKQTLTRLEVYAQDGRLLKAANRPSYPGISLAELPANLYIIVLELDDGTRLSSVVSKQ